MNNLLKTLLVLLMLIPTLTFAHGPARVKVAKEIEINAAPDKVWAIISDYCSIKTWHPNVSECQTDKGTEPGSVRTITLANGETIEEKLWKLDPGRKLIQYSMLKLPQGRIIKGLPVATHGAKITVTENAAGSKVEWKGAFYRAFPGQEPPPELSDDACKRAIETLYTDGLMNIKKLAEQ